MKLKCPISSLEWHSTNGYGTGSAVHPALQQDYKYLLNNLPSYTSGRIVDSESLYLYRLAWFLQLPQITIRHPINRIAAESKLAGLTELIIRAVAASQKYIYCDFPTIVIDKSTCDLKELKHYLLAILDCTSTAAKNSRELAASAKLNRMEAALERIAKTPIKRHKTKGAKVLAEWAAQAGNFPTSITTTPLGIETTLADYWKQIVEASFAESTSTLLSLSIPAADIEELIEHCEEEIPHGTTSAATLMSSLRAAQKLIGELTSNPFKIVQREGAALAEKSTPPKPQRSKFPTQLAYMKALARWQAEAIAIQGTSLEL